MGVRTLQLTDGAVFFCTFTCWNWLALIERTKTYDRIYNWMHIATGKGFSILGYVIMPNHVHLLIHAPEGASINALLANAKRFLAYDILERLQASGDISMLVQLQQGVRPGDAHRGQQHRVFATSSDIREVLDEAMLIQKLDYMHANPVTGVWNLVEQAHHYPHSSMAFYVNGPGLPCPAPIVHYHMILHG
jgi:REP element-mobilizing transposase RayT